VERLWTWGGTSFGYRDGDSLWTHDGRHVGQFDGDEVFGTDGRYLGEVLNSRLFTCRSKKSQRSSSVSPYANRVGIIQSVGLEGTVMYAGYEDFPRPEQL
jgi:hypothetical protein